MLEIEAQNRREYLISSSYSKGRMKGEKRPIEPLERVCSSGTAIPNAMAKVPNCARPRPRCGRATCGRALKLRESLAYTQGLSHDPTPRKSLATWPTTKEYHDEDRCENTRGRKQDQAHRCNMLVELTTIPTVQKERSSSIGSLTLGAVLEINAP
jgi:hypothetical protein